MSFKIREIEIEAGSLSAQSRGTNLNQNGTGAAMKVEPPSKLNLLDSDVQTSDNPCEITYSLCYRNIVS